MFRIRHGLSIGLIAIIAAVAYANNSDTQPPLGVVPKTELNQPSADAPAAQPGAPIVPAIPQEMPGVEQIPVRPTEAETAAQVPPVSTEAEESKPVKIVKKMREDSFPMPCADRKVVDRAIREATQRPVTAASSESKTVYAYTPDSIYTIYGAPGRVIDIQLQPGEKLSGPVIAGDTVRWVVGTATSGNNSAVTHVLVKPIMAGIETNFIITTDRHSYHLIAKSLNRNFLPTVSWTYPQDEMAKFEAYSHEGQGGGDTMVTNGIAPDRLNFKYRIDPDKEYPWNPVRVFDDGTKTYIQMSRNMKNTEAPVFFIKDKRGLNLVNYRVKGEYYIIDRLFDEGEFRCGKDEVVSIRRENPLSQIGSYGPYSGS
jgi:type IV secretion system protein VirB9